MTSMPWFWLHFLKADKQNPSGVCIYRSPQTLSVSNYLCEEREEWWMLSCTEGDVSSDFRSVPAVVFYILLFFRMFEYAAFILIDLKLLSFCGRRVTQDENRCESMLHILMSWAFWESAWQKILKKKKYSYRRTLFYPSSALDSNLIFSCLILKI